MRVNSPKQRCPALRFLISVTMQPNPLSWVWDEFSYASDITHDFAPHTKNLLHGKAT